MIENADGHARIKGPCGDTMEFWLKAQGDKLGRVSFITDGCGSSLACGSMTTTMAEGRSIEEVFALGQEEILGALEGCLMSLSIALSWLSIPFMRHAAITLIPSSLQGKRR